MANLGTINISTEDNYVNITTLTDLTFTTGTKYNFQVQNCNSFLTVCESSSKPTKGGTRLKNFEKFSWTPESGINLWVKTNYYVAATLNVSV